MENLAGVVILAILQGVTEFLPISSSGHLIIVRKFIEWSVEGVWFDVAVHVGSLSAVVIYFRTDLRQMLDDTWQGIKERSMHRGGAGRLGLAIIIGTIPAGLCGLILTTFLPFLLEEILRTLPVILTTTVLFGIVLGLGCTMAPSEDENRHAEYHITLKQALLIGLAQAIALIPGTSRSGITMTAGWMLGIPRQAAARFSFLLSIPVIILAGAQCVVEMFGEGAGSQQWLAALIGAIVAGVMAYICISGFLQLLKHIGIWPFVGYRLILGALLGLMILV